MTNSTHIAFMQRALDLAVRGKGYVSPNPCVGCVLVKGGKVVGEGFHARFGGPHAEVIALEQAGAKAKGSTAYLTLEPCTHWGKTPPCAPELVHAGIKEIHIAIKDPNPVVSGRGIGTLQKAGIKVHLGLCAAEAALLNRSFITWMTKGRPHIVLKMAMTLDGKTATKKGESKWISSSASRRLVHKLRAESDAVLVGADTANHDNPSLTSHGQGRDPLRIVIDPRLRTRKSLKIYQDAKAPTLIVTSRKLSAAIQKTFQKRGVQILRKSLRFNQVDMLKTLRNIAEMNVSQVLIEGGGETAWTFIKHNLVDEIYFFIAPKILGGREALTPVGGEGFTWINQARTFKNVSVSRIGPDILLHATQGVN